MTIVHPLHEQIKAILSEHGYIDPTGGIRIYKLSFALQWMGQNDINKYEDIYDMMNVILRLKCPKYKGRIEDNKGNTYIMKSPNLRQIIITALQKKVLDMLPTRDTPNYLYLQDFISGVNPNNPNFLEFLIERFVYDRHEEIENLEEIDAVVFRNDIKDAYDDIIENDSLVESFTNNAYYDYQLYVFSLYESHVYDKRTKKMTLVTRDKFIREMCMSLFKINEITDQKDLESYLEKCENRIGEQFGNIGADQILREYDGLLDYKNVKKGAPEDLMFRELLEKVNSKRFPDNHICSKRMAAQYIYYCLNGEKMIAPNGKITQKEALIINDLLSFFGYYPKNDKSLSKKDIYHRIKPFFRYDKEKKRYCSVY